MIKRIAAATLLVGLASIQLSAAGRKGEKPMEWKGQHGGPIAAGSTIATDMNAWTRLWRTLGQNAPPLDFKTHFAVAVFAGERPTGGYTVEFLDPAPKGLDLTLRYKIKAPSGFTTQVISQPWTVRAFARVKGKIFVVPVPPEDEPK